jgi:hypothetical protein
MKLYLLGLLVLLFAFPFDASAQNMKVTGTVYDSTGTKPLNQALAMAVRLKDSLLLGFERTDANGNFVFNSFAPDTFSLIISHSFYDEKSFFIFGNSGNREIDIPKIKMSTEAKLLGEVVIYSNKNPIYFSGDTLVYVADSFKVGENAVVEDMLKKLPGVKVDKDGKITSQGKSIGQVLVDGDEFFGSDPTIATKNLAAKGVETVRVYEKKSDVASEGDDATIQVMDLRLKNSAKKGYFGKVSLASDFQNFHESELLLNKFNGPQKISFFALGSTTPRTNVSRADMNKFGLDNNQQGNFMNDDGQMNWGGNNSTRAAGVPRTFSTGVFYTDKIGAKQQTKIGFNYTFNDYQLISSSASRSMYSLPSDTTYYSDDSTSNVDISQAHKINFNLFSQIDSLTTFEIKPKFNFSSGTLENTNLSDFSDERDTLSRSSIIANMTKSQGFSLDNNATLIHKFKKPKRYVSLNYDLSATIGESTGTLDAYNSYVDPLIDSDTTNQEKINKTKSQTHIGKVTYVEPLTKKVKVELEYLYEYGLSGQNKETRDGVNGVYDELNTALSNNFDNLRQQHRLSTILIYEKRVQTFTAGVRIRNIEIENQNLTLGTTIYQNVSNYLPLFKYSYKPSQSKRFNVNYSTRSAQPAIADLQLVQNNTNPNRITIGNPDLKPNYEHAMNINFNSWQALSGRYVWAGVNSTFTNNAFAQKTEFDNFGRTVSQTVNVDGNVFASANASAGFPFYKKIFEVSPGFNTSYSKYSSFVKYSNTEALRNTTTTQAITGELDFEVNLDSLQMSFGGKYTYNVPKNSISTLSNNPYSLQVYSADLTWTMRGNFKLSSDFSYTINSQRADGYNINFFVWNASVSKAFLKTENLIVSLSGNDILNQNISAARTVNGNIITDNRTKIISRYFLLKVVFKFNNNRIKEEDAKHGWH